MAFLTYKVAIVRLFVAVEETRRLHYLFLSGPQCVEKWNNNSIIQGSELRLSDVVLVALFLDVVSLS